MAARAAKPTIVEVSIERAALSGLRNMELDVRLLRRADSTSSPATWVRFYRWRVPTVSLGNRQRAAAAIDEGFCRRRGIPVVVRPTGGLAVLHADELTYAVVSNDPSRFPPTIMGSYLVVADALRRGFSRLGLNVDVAPPAESSAADSAAPCFLVVSSHEITFRGRKLVGSAQRRTRRAFLQHGSIPLTIDYDLMAEVFRSDPVALRRRFVGVGEALGRRVSFNELATALRDSFLHIRAHNPSELGA